MGSQQWGKLDINQYNVHILSSVSVCFTLSVWLLERQNFNLDNAQYLEFWEKIFWKGISNISLCVVREGEINFKLSTSSFISDFTDNAAAQGGAPDITSTWKCLSTNFKLISLFLKKRHNLSNTWRVLHANKLLSWRFCLRVGRQEPDGEWGRLGFSSC